MQNGDSNVVICVVNFNDLITLDALRVIKSLNCLISIRATLDGMEFSLPNGIDENRRHAWENIIRGLILVT